MTISESFRDLNSKKITPAQFMERVRRDSTLKKFVTNITSFKDTVKILQNKGILTEAIVDTTRQQPDWEDELLNIVLGYVKDPDEAIKYVERGSDYWPDWLDANMQRDPAYQDYLASQNTGEAEIEDTEDWIDPAGGTHSAGEEDPAAMYREAEMDGGRPSLDKDYYDDNGQPVDDEYPPEDNPFFMGREAFHLENGKNPFNPQTNPEDFDEWRRGWNSASDEETGEEDYDISDFDSNEEDPTVMGDDRPLPSPYYEEDPEEKYWRDAATYDERNSDMDSDGVSDYNDGEFWESKSLKEAFNKGDKVYAIVGSGPSEKIVKGTYVGKKKDVDGKETHSIKGTNGKITLHPKIKKGDPDVEQKKWLKDLKEGVEIIPAEVRKGVNYELGLYDQPISDWDSCFFTKEEVEKATKKVIKNLEKDSLYYTILCGTGKKPKAEKESEIKYKESAVNDTTNKTDSDGNLTKAVKKNEKSNVKDTLSKTEKAKGKPKGVTVMKDKGVEGKEKIINEGLLKEYEVYYFWRDGVCYQGNDEGAEDEVPSKYCLRYIGKDNGSEEMSDVMGLNSLRGENLRPGVDLGAAASNLNSGIDKEESLHALMKKYDWYYEMSDDDRKYRSGKALDSEIRRLAKQVGVDKALAIFNQYAPDDRKKKADFFTENRIKEVSEEEFSPKIYYYEFDNWHRSKTYFTLAELTIILTAWEDDDDDTLEVFIEELEKRGKNNLYVFIDVLYETNLIKTLLQKKSIGIMGEEGSAGLSLESLLAAKKAAEKMEFDDDFDDDDNFNENKNNDMNKEEYTGEYDHLGKQQTIRKPKHWTSNPERMDGTRGQNSIDQVIAYLKDNPGKSEREILRDIWGFERGRSQSNKKFADLLRRGLQSGKIARAKKVNPSGQTKYFYYIPNTRNTDNFDKADFAYPGDTPTFENKYDLTGKMTDRFPGHGKRGKDDIPARGKSVKVTPKEKMNKNLKEEQEQDTPIIWINRDFSLSDLVPPIKGVTVKKGDKGSIVRHEHENQYLVKFNGHRFYAFLDIHFKPFKNEARISLKEKMNKVQLKERIANKVKEAIMYKIGSGGEGTEYTKTTDRDLEDKLKKTGISFKKKNIS